jgi:light-regulated signal transduction histidine kinase (bacteriophytochrome)
MNDDKCPTDWPRLMELATYELRIPLTVVNGYARLLHSGRTGASSDERRHAYAELERAAKHAIQVVEKMQQVQALETGRRWTTGEKTELSLESVIRDTIAAPGWRWDPQVAVDVLITADETVVMAHAEPLKRAVVAAVLWVCGELGRKHRYRMHIRIADSPGPFRNIVVAETADLTHAAVLPDARLERFDDYQDATNLDLPLATRTIAAHGGRMWWLEGTIGLRIALPVR